MDSRATKIRDDSEADLESMQTVRDEWNDREAMVISKVYDSVSKNTRSRVTDSRLTTIALESSIRTMAQLAKGQVKAVSKKQRGGALLLDLMLHRHIIPNDNEGWDHLTKLRMLDFYSRVYGTMPIMYDWHVSKNYTGPVSRIIQARDRIPQRGRVSVEDSDYTHIDNYVSYQWLKGKAKDKNWETGAIKKILKEIEKEQGESAKATDSRKTSTVEEERNTTQRTGKGKNSKILLRTRYEAGDDGHWVTSAPDYEWAILRDIKNPHSTGLIPLVEKINIPLIDSYFGLSDFERGKSIQFAMDSLTNLTLEAVKRNVFPPRIINPNGVVASSLTWAPGKNWLETTRDSIRTFDQNPTGINHFQAIYGFLTGSLMNQAGTTDTTLNAEQSSSSDFGKTPQALKMLEARENSRDTMNRFFMEKAIEKLYNGFISLTIANHEKPLDLSLFEEEIRAIKKQGFEDIDEMLDVSSDEKMAEITISKSDIKGKYRYYVDAGSTAKKDNAEQTEALSNLLLMASKIPQISEMVAAKGQVFDIAQLIKELVNRSGVENPEKIIYPAAAADTTELQEAQAPAPQQVPGVDPTQAMMGPRGAMQGQMSPQGMIPGMPMALPMPQAIPQAMAPPMGAPMDIPLAGQQPNSQIQSVVDRLLA